MKGYEDITHKFVSKGTKQISKIEIRKFIRINGKTYIKKQVRPNSDKKVPEVAEWLKDTFGGKTFINPEVKGHNMPRSADLNFRNQKWEVKSPTGNSIRTIDNNIISGKGQANNFVIDITNSKISLEDGIERLNKIYKDPKRYYVNKIILRKGEKYIVTKKNRAYPPTNT